MTTPVRFRGVRATVSGRLTVPVRVPDDLLAEAERIAERIGEERAVVLGDLVASALPAALAESADDLFGSTARERLGATCLHDAEPPRLGSGAGSRTPHLTGATVDLDVTRVDLDDEDDPGGVAD